MQNKDNTQAPAGSSIARPKSLSRLVAALLIAVLAALVPLAVAEVTVRLVARRIVSHSYTAYNNALVDRFWRKYTAPVEHLGGRRIIVITNSQGHLSEANPASSYPNQLEQMLNEHDPKHTYHVANWALPGGNAGELIVLAARAADHHPDAVILATFSNNFSAGVTDYNAAYSRNDVEQLAYLPQVRHRISPWFLDHYHISRIHGWLAAFTGLMNMHDSLVFWLRDETRPQERLLLANPERPAIPAKPVTREGVRLIREIRYVLQRGLPNTPVLVISMPLSKAKILPETWAATDDFFRDAEDIFSDSPQFTVVDAKQVVQPELFFTASHMRPEGHRIFARWLLPQVLSLFKQAESHAI